jgi:hypothetical protein
VAGLTRLDLDHIRGDKTSSHIFLSKIMRRKTGQNGTTPEKITRRMSLTLLPRDRGLNPAHNPKVG